MAEGGFDGLDDENRPLFDDRDDYDDDADIQMDEFSNEMPVVTSRFQEKLVRRYKHQRVTAMK